MPRCNVPTCDRHQINVPEPATTRADYVIYDPPMNPHDEQRFGRVTLVGLIIAIFGVAFMFGGHPVISALLLLLAWVLVVLDEDMRSGTR